MKLTEKEKNEIKRNIKQIFEGSSQWSKLTDAQKKIIIEQDKKRQSGGILFSQADLYKCSTDMIGLQNNIEQFIFILIESYTDAVENTDKEAVFEAYIEPDWDFEKD